VIVTTNVNKGLFEYNTAGTAQTNNTTSTALTSALGTYADLTVANIGVQSPTAPQSGNQVTLGWDDSNVGNAAVSSSFTDSVLVQRVNADNSRTTIASGNVSDTNSIAAGAVSHETFTFTLSDGAAGVGNFVVTMTADSGQSIKEFDASGNTTYGNNTNTGTFTTTLAAYADLTVGNVALQSPASPQSGNQVII